MSKKPAIPSIPDTEEAWSSGELGREEEYAAVAPDENVDVIINEHLGLQLISIRLEKSLIEDYKLIAKMNGLGYQPLMRQILKRFADSEKNRILREVAAETNHKKKSTDGLAEDPPIAKQKKVA
jgi:uncharacterized protein (DUF4415 family)